ncbi:MAG TPA: hypothetical protein VNG12_25955 [Acidimicrobiales bacterium]|nr:hypothetical protein [Acidimicrobiales bacterium]
MTLDMVVVLIVLAIIAFVRRVRRDRRSQGYPYVRGTEYYRRSLEYRSSTVVMRLNQGLPPYHEESMWRNPSEVDGRRRRGST